MLSTVIVWWVALTQRGSNGTAVLLKCTLSLFSAATFLVITKCVSLDINETNVAHSVADTFPIDLVHHLLLLLPFPVIKIIITSYIRKAELYRSNYTIFFLYQCNSVLMGHKLHIQDYCTTSCKTIRLSPVTWELACRPRKTKNN